MRNLICTLALLIMSTGCGKKQKQAVKVADAVVPSWAVSPEPGCAIGAYKVKGNVPFAMDISVDRATHQLARQLQVVTNSIVRDYIEEGNHNEESFSEDLVFKASESIVSLNLSGVVPRKQGVSGEYFFSMVCLDTDTFIESFSNMKQLDEKVRNDLRKRAETKFKKLEERAAY